MYPFGIQFGQFFLYKSTRTHDLLLLDQRVYFIVIYTELTSFSSV